jgi:hypothetical protein
MQIGKRLQIEGPHWGRPWRGGHGGDEYGNCTFYVSTGLGGFTLWYDLHAQFEVELPNPGENKWIDYRFFRELEDDMNGLRKY